MLTRLFWIQGNQVKKVINEVIIQLPHQLSGFLFAITDCKLMFGKIQFVETLFEN